MYDPETRKLFQQLLRQEVSCAERLAQLLAEERDQLTSGDPDTLIGITEDKAELLKELDRWVAAHEGFLQARRLPPGKQGSEAFLRTLPERAQEWGLWRRLQEIAAVCRDGNEINGGIVTLGHARVRRALDLLRGTSVGTTTYGRAGVSNGDKVSQFIGKV